MAAHHSAGGLESGRDGERRRARLFAAGPIALQPSTRGSARRNSNANLTHGGKRTDDKTTFDQKAGTRDAYDAVPEPAAAAPISTSQPARATRWPSPITRASNWARAGCRTPQQSVLRVGVFGDAWSTPGAENITFGREDRDNRPRARAVKGPKADFQFDIFFARDAARTPLSIRIPLPLGIFTLDLVR